MRCVWDRCMKLVVPPSIARQARAGVTFPRPAVYHRWPRLGQSKSRPPSDTIRSRPYHGQANTVFPNKCRAPQATLKCLKRILTFGRKGVYTVTDEGWGTAPRLPADRLLAGAPRHGRRLGIGVDDAVPVRVDDDGARQQDIQNGGQTLFFRITLTGAVLLGLVGFIPGLGDLVPAS